MKVTVGELMVEAVIQVGEQETLGEAKEKMSAHHIGAVPVVNSEGVLVGIITADDLVSDYPSTLPVSRVMSAPVHTLAPEADAAQAARMMREHRHHHIVVVEGTRVTGILSTFDLLGLIEESAEQLDKDLS